MPLLLWRKQWKEIKLKLTTDRFAGASWFPLSVKKCLLFEINSKGCRIHILNYSLVPGTLWSLKRHYVCHFPAIAFVTFLPFRLSFSATLRLSFSTIAFSFSRPSLRHFSAIVFVFFRHFVCHFPAIAFVIFPPLHSSLSLHCVRQSPLFPPFPPFVITFGPFVTFSPVGWSFYHLVTYVCHFPAITFVASRLKVCPEF